MITLQPGMRTARLYEGLAIQPKSQAENPYSFFFTSMLRHNPTADVFTEDLGHKTIEGIDALGVKTTQIGSEEDEWKGKPIRIFETWVSDDLAATLVRLNYFLQHDGRILRVADNPFSNHPDTLPLPGTLLAFLRSQLGRG